MIYVLHVHTGKEQAIQDVLQHQGYKALVPCEIRQIRQGGCWKFSEYTLIPGYVFVESEMSGAAYYEIKSIPHVIRFLGGGSPTPISESEAKHINWLCPGGLPLQASELTLGGTVVSGPLKGHEDAILSMNKRQRRAKVGITIMGEQKEITLSVNFNDRSNNH